MTVRYLSEGISTFLTFVLGWRGRNERTGMEGIFPRSYVNVVDEKAAVPPPSGYGNMPLEVSQSGATPVTTIGPDGKPQTKFEEHGKKFGKKMGNAGMFL